MNMSELLQTKNVEQLKQEMGPVKASQILRHTKFTQRRGGLISATDPNRRCAVGVLATFIGWDGYMCNGNWSDPTDPTSTLPIYNKVTEGFNLPFDSRTICGMNDYDKSFEEIADWLEEMGL